MNHEQAVAGDFAGRYLAGTLADAELEAFENHFVDCPACQCDLDADERIRAGFRAAQSAGLLVEPARQRRRHWLGAYAMAASVLLAVSVGWGLRLQADLGARGRISTGEGEGIATITPVVRLVTMRSADGRPDAVLEKREGVRNWLLDVDVPRECADGSREAVCADGRRPWRPQESAYRIDVRGPDGDRPVFASAEQPPLDSGAVVFVLPVDALRPGRYRVFVSGRAPVAEFTLEVVAK